MDKIIRATAAEGSVKMAVLTARDTVQAAREIHGLSPTACAALGRALCAASLLGQAMKEEKATLTIRINGGGPIGSVVAVSDCDGYVRGYTENPGLNLPLRADGKLNVGAAVGRDGTFTVSRDIGLKEPYIGQVNLVSGELGEDFAQYYTVSEQTPSLVALGARVSDGMPLSTGGILVQAMPGCEEETLNQLELRSMLFADISRELAENDLMDLANAWFDGLEPRLEGRQELHYRCDCSRERMERALAALGREELTDILNTDGYATLTCHFCRTSRVFDENDLRRLLEEGSADA